MQSGPPGRSATEMGINYLALNDLFLICDKRKDMMTYEIYVQMVEIYNEQVRDLLAENSSCTKYPFMLKLLIFWFVYLYNDLPSVVILDYISTLDIRTCSSEDDGLSLPDATMHSVNSTMDVLRLMEAGEVNRAVSSTSMNNRSSRSHRFSSITKTTHTHSELYYLKIRCLFVVFLWCTYVGKTHQEVPSGVACIWWILQGARE